MLPFSLKSPVKKNKESLLIKLMLLLEFQKTSFIETERLPYVQEVLSILYSKFLVKKVSRRVFILKKSTQALLQTIVLRKVRT